MAAVLRPAFVGGDVLVGGVLVGAGVVGLLLGGTFLVLAEDVEGLAEGEETYGNFVDDLESASRRRALAVGCFVAGGALIVGGAVRYTLAGGDDWQASAVISDDGAALVITGGLP